MCDLILARMESVIKVLLPLGKDYSGKDTPSKKELAAVVFRLE